MSTGNASPKQQNGLAGYAGGLDVPRSVPMQDLSGDRLLLTAPRIKIDGKDVPALGGIALLAKIGQGGMGAVYYGIHPRLQSEVAVKVLPITLAESQPELVQRFIDEARLAALVKSTHLVTTLDINQEKGLFYLVMEFVNGITARSVLKQKLNKGEPGLHEVVALEICIAAFEGLAAAHAKNIIHRDVKPDNILVPREGPDGTLIYSGAKLMDLGLARMESGEKSATAAGMGTPGYVSPEQATNATTAGKPSDTFSAGATLYALLCGRPPFGGENTTEIVLNTISKPYAPVTTFRQDISPRTVALLTRALNKEVARRFPDAALLLKALKSCRETLGESAPKSAAPASVPAPAAPPAPVEKAARKEPKAKSSVEEALKLASAVNAAAKPAQVAPVAISAENVVQRKRNRAAEGGLFVIVKYVFYTILLAVLTGVGYVYWQNLPKTVEAPPPPPPARPVGPTAPPDTALPAVPVDSDPELRKALKEAEAALKRGDQNEVINILEPQVEANRNRGFEYRARAEAMIRNAQTELKRRADAQLKLIDAERLLGEKDFDRARLYFMEAAAMWPESSEKIRLKEGLAAAEKGLTDKRFEIAVNEGMRFLSEQRFDDAAPLFTRALRERPGNQIARYGLGMLAARRELTGRPVINGIYQLENERVVKIRAALNDALLAVPGDNAATQMRVMVGVEIEVLKGHSANICSLAAGPGNRMYSGSWDKTIRAWDISKGTESTVLRGHTGNVNALQVSPDGKRLASGSSDKSVRLWDLEKQKELLRFDGHSGPVISMAFSADGQFVWSGALDKTIRQWSVASGKEVRHVDGDFTCIAFSPDMRRAICGSWDNANVRVISLDSGSELRGMKGHGGPVTSVAFSRDGKQMLSGSSDKSVRLWDINGAQLKVLIGHDGPVVSVQFSPDGLWAFSGSGDKNCCLWELSSGRLIRRYEGHTNLVEAVAISQDGRRGYSTGNDETIRVWGLPKLAEVTFQPLYPSVYGVATPMPEKTAPEPEQKAPPKPEEKTAPGSALLTPAGWVYSSSREDVGFITNGNVEWASDTAFAGSSRVALRGLLAGFAGRQPLAMEVRQGQTIVFTFAHSDLASNSHCTLRIGGKDGLEIYSNNDDEKRARETTDKPYTVEWIADKTYPKGTDIFWRGTSHGIVATYWFIAASVK